MKNTISIISLFALGLTSCDYVEQPIPNTGQVAAACDTITFVYDTPSLQKNVLLEEFSGHKCPNCPAATAEVENLVNTHGSRIVPVTIHPDPANNSLDNLVAESPPGTGEYETIWYFPESGDILSQFTDPGYLPVGLVDRTYNSSFAWYYWDYTDWNNEVTARLSAPLDISLTTDAILLSDGTVCGSTISEFIDDVSTVGDIRMIHYLVEDSIPDWQQDGATNIPNFMHRHVLRGVSENNINGVVIGPNGGLTGQIDTIGYSFENYTVVDDHHLSVISFVIDTDSKEVLQSVYKHVRQ